MNTTPPVSTTARRLPVSPRRPRIGCTSEPTTFGTVIEQPDRDVVEAEVPADQRPRGLAHTEDELVDPSIARSTAIGPRAARGRQPKGRSVRICAS